MRVLRVEVEHPRTRECRDSFLVEVGGQYTAEETARVLERESRSTTIISIPAEPVLSLYEALARLRSFDQVHGL